MKTYTIKNTTGITLNEFYRDLDAGGKLVIYGYCISIIALTFRLISSPYFIRPGESQSKFKRRYNTLSLIFGWWGLPWGPIYTIDMIKINSKSGGGVDVTNELIPKLTEKYIYHDAEEIFTEGITIDYNDNELTR